MIIDLEFANTLEQIAKDKDTFYSGDLAKTILADLQGKFCGQIMPGKISQKFGEFSTKFLVNCRSKMGKISLKFLVLQNLPKICGKIFRPSFGKISLKFLVNCRQNLVKFSIIISEITINIGHYGHHSLNKLQNFCYIR